LKRYRKPTCGRNPLDAEIEALIGLELCAVATGEFFYVLFFNERQRTIPLPATCIMGHVLSRSDKIGFHIPDIGWFELQQLEKCRLKQILRIPPSCPSLNP
jgi:hypothetical protein